MADDKKTVTNTEGKEKETSRVKDDHAGHNHMIEGLSDDMKNFYHELNELFPDLRVTSGKREPTDKFSHHHEGDAIDLGKENHAAYDHLMNTREGLQLMSKYGLGILDETDPAAMKKTGATGPHFHIGKDKGLASNTTKRLADFDNAEYKTSYFVQNPDYDYGSGTGGSTTGIADGGASEATQFSAFKAVVPRDIMNMFNAELEKEVEKDAIKAEKEAESESRRLLKEKQEEEDAKYQNMINTMEGLRDGDEEMLQREDLTDKYAIQPVEQLNVTPQTSLPTLPNIFNI